MKRDSELTFKDLNNSAFGAFTRVYWNGKLIFDDEIQEEMMFKNPDGEIVQMYNNKDVETFGYKSLTNVLEKYGPKKIYNFYCRIHSFHHTELFIEGEK